MGFNSAFKGLSVYEMTSVSRGMHSYAEGIARTYVTSLKHDKFSRVHSNIQSGPKKMYTLFTRQYLWNKFKLNFYFMVRV